MTDSALQEAKTDGQYLNEFMGLEPKLLGYITSPEKVDNIYDFNGYPNHKLGTSNSIEGNFSTSWDWLMPACKKWDDLKFIKGKQREQSELCDLLDHYVSCYEILPAYQQLVKNIRWHQQQSNG